MSELRTIIVYTDGACLRNPGPGGFAAVLLHGDRRREISGGRRLTTNNRMEMMAAVEALRAIRPRCAVTVHSDSRYVVDGVMAGWAARRLRAGRAGMPNADLWEALLAECERHLVTMEWVPGHAGVAENERCDALALSAARAAELPADEGYEQPEARVAGPKQGVLFS